MHRKIVVVCACSLLAACASSPTTNDKLVEKDFPHERQNPELSIMRLAQNIDYRYVIYGDPVVSPLQAFSDGQFLYLQLAPNQSPPLPYTRSGDLLEYEVIRSVMKIRKEDSVVLRIGPRRAYVDHKDVKIIPLTPDIPVIADVKVADSTIQSQKNVQVTLPVDAASADVIEKTSAAKVWRVCHARTVAETKAALRLKSLLLSVGRRAILDDTCSDDGIINLKGENS